MNIILKNCNSEELEFLQSFNLNNLKIGDILYLTSDSDCNYNLYVNNIDDNNIYIKRIRCFLYNNNVLKSISLPQVTS